MNRPFPGFVPALICAAFTAPYLASDAAADEGMWLFNQFPFDMVEKAYGFRPDTQWLDHVQRSSVRLEGGCSGSFVSGSGLIMTNHHCAEECIDQLSSPKKDYRTDGFWAKTPADEIRCPTVAIDQLVEIKDVTAQVHAVRAGKSDKEGNDAIKAEIAAVEKACQTSEALRCQVVNLYNGGMYNLYTYQRYEDVRLVFAPEFRIAFFGGDPDNFEFPRYDLDVTFLRVYEGGKPLATKDHFAWSKAGTQEGELTFVTGHPGSTNRLWTISEIETWRDYGLIPRLAYLSELRGVLLGYAQRGKEQARHSMGLLFGIENGLKAFKGEFEALREPGLLRQMREREKALRDTVLADGAKSAAAGAWDAIAAAQKVQQAVLMRYRLVESGRGLMSELLTHARVLVRGADELAKPNADRLREFTEGDLASTKQELFSAAPIYPEFEIFKLAWSLAKLRENLGADDPFVRSVLGNESPEALAKRVIGGTKLRDVKVRQALFDGGATAIAASKDPLIELARRVDPEARAVRARYEDEVEAVVHKNHELIAAARFAAYGGSVYPDATFTLRLSYGAVKGYTDNGQAVVPYTTFGGAFARHTGADPFRLPDSWIQKKAVLDLDTPFDLATTNDIIGGNSGSPVINKAAEVVGLIFDGNIQSLGGDYGFDAEVNRAVAVDSRALIHALEKVYGADRLVQELRH